MKTYTDKELADYLLEMRQRDGRPASWSRLKKDRWRVVLFFGIYVLFFCVSAFLQTWWLCGFIIGLAWGGLSRDRAHAQQLQKVWPFYGKVIDWIKVEKIAEDKPPA